MGTIYDRPSVAVAWMMRFNTEVSNIEFYDGTSWRLVKDTLVATGGTEIDAITGGVMYKIHVFD
jgi:hypothetical protein